ncbi:hypothetical protein RhiirA5_411367 [Rhizophagus irregularis]|uniref:Uncharacterized protein n=1 Tax=Rhizophagus irregularis TaxID=588596 RepID=A0A2N0Q144_9GLOM|nr:hypothetical protein RhiirA5_411367 [Rhizophagus irregularis]CAB5145820.1 unnamed protein product [Rhizophagus irregularis]
MDAFQIIYTDLYQNQPAVVVPYPPPFDDNISHGEKFRILKEAIERAKRFGNRILLLTNLFYMGHFLEKEMTGTLRSYYAQQLSIHYRTSAIRIYYIFELPGVAQITRTTQTTSTMIRQLSHEEYQKLVTESIGISTGVEIFAGDDVTNDQSRDKNSA